MQVVLGIKNKRTLYCSGEESEKQLRLRAERLGNVDNPNCYIVSSTLLEDIFVHIKNVQPDIVIVDSIQTISTENMESGPGSISQVRECAAQILRYAKESGVPADVVIGVPDSGLSAAQGYAKATGIPYASGLIKNRYIGRTFIAPTQRERENMVFLKLNAVRSVVDGKRVVVIDDSIVRGTTSRRLVQILRRAGAKEVHFRIASPPVKFPCYVGIDTPSRNELISNKHNVQEICKEIGADTLAFISAKGMLEACRECNPDSYGFCEGCFTGVYPMSVPGEIHGKKL
jgi:amidophosphoribosyltransferase